MALTSLDVIVLLAVAGAAMMGAVRGFVTEVLSLFAWVAIVAALKLFHISLAQSLTGIVGTVSGAAVLAFALIAGGTYLGGKLVANAIGKRTRTSILGPVDRALGFGFGALKGLILASLAFLLTALVVDTVGGGPSRRPGWMVRSRTYPLLNATSAGIADFVDRRRRGQPVFGARPARRRRMSAPLYNAEILRLAASIPHQARLDPAQATAERRSPICGSRVTVDVNLDADDRVAAIGLVVRACALGQASAALLAAEVLGRTPEDLAAARDALTAWLANGQGDPPAWPGLAVFGPALAYTARHASIRLAFEAAAEAAAAARAR